MRFFRRSLPAELRQDLHADEAVTAHAVTVDGTQLAVTRRRLLVLPVGGQRTEIAWAQVAKATLADRTLSLTPLQPVAELPDGGILAVDGEPLTFTFERSTKLTDQIHTRVRSSVAAAKRLPWPGAGGWVTTRKVAGKDGLTLQIRLDPGADPQAPGFLDAALQLGEELLAGEPSDPDDD